MQYAQATNTSGGWAYQSVALSDSLGSEPLPAFSTSIKVQDIGAGNNTTDDIWLFDQTSTSSVVDGYITNWSSLFRVANDPSFRSVANGGRVAFANLDGAITITGAPRSFGLPESGLDISIGKLGCRSEDFR